MTADLEELKKKVEAIIFSAGRVVEIEEMLGLIKGSKEEDIKKAAKEIKKEYEERNSPLLVTPEGKGWKLTVREKHLPLVQEINPHTELSRQVLATLAVIAWKTPVLQSEVIKIRTNKAYEHVKELEELGFISKEKKGRSFLLRATGKFFDYFDLPTKEAAKNMFKDVADKYPEEESKAKEIQKKLGSLKIVDIKEEQPHRVSIQRHDAERLGQLEVYEEPQKKPSEDVREYGEEETDEGEEPEEGEAEPEYEEEPEEGEGEPEEDEETRRLHPELENVLATMPEEEKEKAEEKEEEPEEKEEEEPEEDEEKEEETEEPDEEEPEDEEKEEDEPEEDEEPEESDEEEQKIKDFPTSEYEDSEEKE